RLGPADVGRTLRGEQVVGRLAGLAHAVVVPARPPGRVARPALTRGGRGGILCPVRPRPTRGTFACDRPGSLRFSPCFSPSWPPPGRRRRGPPTSRRAAGLRRS